MSSQRDATPFEVSESTPSVLLYPIILYARVSMVHKRGYRVVWYHMHHDHAPARTTCPRRRHNPK